MVEEKTNLKVEDMKSSEILDSLNEDHTEGEFDSLDKELLSRYPFSYYFKNKFEELEEKINELNKLLRHDHKHGKIVTYI